MVEEIERESAEFAWGVRGHPWAGCEPPVACTPHPSTPTPRSYTPTLLEEAGATAEGFRCDG